MVAAGRKVIVRFAPSPTGYLHVGNIRTALVNWLFAKKHGGEFHLRLDDTDKERSKQEYEDAIREDLTWLGLGWEDFSQQSARFPRYEEAKQKLLASGRLYPCYETQEELDVQRKMLTSRGLPPIYDRGALKLTAEQRTAYEAQGRKPHYRFLLEDKPVEWNDLIRGTVRFEGTHMSDPVLVREDGIPLYTFCSVVDDGDFGTTHILRGEDHVSNTAVQMQIFEAMGTPAPSFGHMALIRTKEGELSKRTGGGDVRSLRAEGIEPMTINSYLAKLGTSDAIDVFPDMQALVAAFDISRFGRAAANYDAAELERLNAKLVSQISFADAKGELPQGADEVFWNTVRPNIARVKDAAQWWQVLNHAPANYPEEESTFLQEAVTMLPDGAWDDATWKSWTGVVSEKTGRKGKTLFMPIRLALTGMEHGPEMSRILPLLGREKVLARLKGKVSAS